MPKKKPTLILPDKLSELLKWALADLSRVEKDPTYRIDMSDWHRPGYTNTPRKAPEKVCYVCLAGAVMTRACKPEHNIYPDEFEQPVRKKLIALDYVRSGNILSCCSVFFSEDEAGKEKFKRVYAQLELLFRLNDKPYCAYQKSRRQFKTYVRSVIKILEKVGL
jgi:hypothetical protein